MDDCIFCKIVRGEAPSWKVMETALSYAFLDINPASRYHTLIIPKSHYVNMFDIEEEALKDVIALTRKVALLYKEKLDINNIQIITNSGKAAQQEVFHLHFHIVPRQFGDGQNVRWHVHPEWRKDFDEMLLAIQ